MSDRPIFRIGFDKRDVSTVMAAWQTILEGDRWTEGDYVRAFEERLNVFFSREAAAMSSWTGAALACLSYYQVSGKRILCPTNTFMATPLAALHLGADVLFGDCNREDLCLSADCVAKAIRSGIELVFLVHIGGHIAFDIAEITRLCRENGVILIEDCAHAFGASWDGRPAGTWGDAAVFSLHATKTVTSGEGGFVVSGDQDLIAYARSFRNYGKPDYAVRGLNFRMDEFRAALALAQVNRLPEIVEWKNIYAREHLDLTYERRLKLPVGMISNYYKYIVFETLPESTGCVYDSLCHELFDSAGRFPNSEWVTANHSCVPIYYDPEVA